MATSQDIAGYQKWQSSSTNPPWPVYTAGTGPAVIVMHELFGLTPDVLRFADRVRAANFTVYLPAFVGPTLADTTLRRTTAALRCCISREINLFAAGTSTVVTPLCALADAVANPYVGVIGMCMSGGFALAAARTPSVTAAVAAEPSLPAVTPFTKRCAAQIGLSPGDERAVRARIGAGDVELYVARFSGDRLSPAARLEAIASRLGPAGIHRDVIDSGPGTPFTFKAHSVLAMEPAKHTSPGPANDRLDDAACKVLAFVSSRLHT